MEIKETVLIHTFCSRTIPKTAIEAVPKRKLHVDSYLNMIEKFTRFSFLSVCDGDKIANYSFN